MWDDLRKRFRERIMRIPEEQTELGTLGAVVDGVPRVEVPNRPGWVYVRLKKGTVVQAVNRGTGAVFGLEVRVREEFGALTVIGANMSAFTTPQAAAAAVAASATPRHTHRFGSGNEDMVEGLRFEPGQVHVGLGGGLQMYVEAFAYFDGSTRKWFAGAPIDLTPYRPTTTNRKAWVLVGLNKSTGELVAATGTEYPLAQTMLPQMIMNTPFSHLLLGAVVLQHGQTASPTWQDFCDCRAWLETGGGGGGSFTGDIMPSVFDARLTLTTGTPVTTSDVTAATSLYLTPFRGNLIALYDGTDWVGYTLSEISLSLSSLAANTNYDIFVYDSSGPTLEAVAWSSNTARATALTQQNGVWVKSGAPTRRYAGTIRTLAAGQCEDSVSRRFVFNYWQQVQRELRVVETANSWTYSGTAWRPLNNATANRVELVIGIREKRTRAFASCMISANSTGNYNAVGIGLDSTTDNSAQIIAGSATTHAPAHASYDGYLSVGYHYLQMLEITAGSGATFYGDIGTTWLQSGMTAETWS